jgi:hypothetical protein
MRNGLFPGRWVVRWRRAVMDVEGRVRVGVLQAYAGIEDFARAGRDAWLVRTARRDRYGERRPPSWGDR